MRIYFNTQLIILLLFPQQGFCQSRRLPISAIYAGVSAYSSKQTDVLSFANNQASLAHLKKIAVGIYGERRFLLAATSLYNASIAIPSKMGNFGISLKYAGFKNFNEQQAGLAYARNLGSNVALGIQFNYYGYRVPAYFHSGTVNFEIGAIVHLTEQLNAGFHVYNIMGGKIVKTGEKLSAAYKMGLGYDASEKFFVTAELVKVEDYRVNVNAGIQYQFMKQFFVRAGISTANSSAFGGAGVGWSNLRLEISGSFHPSLGWSPGLMLIMDFGLLPGQSEGISEKFNSSGF